MVHAFYAWFDAEGDLARRALLAVNWLGAHIAGRAGVPSRAAVRCVARGAAGVDLARVEAVLTCVPIHASEFWLRARN